MINDEKTQILYCIALRDIWLLLVDAPLDLFRFVMHDSAFHLLRRYICDVPASYTDLEADYRRISQGLHRCAEEFPESPWAKALQGRALVGLGHYESAIRGFEAAAQMAPECALINAFCGEAHYYLAGRTDAGAFDHYVSAICYLSDAILLNSSQARPYICRAHCQAHIIAICGYHQDSACFAVYYDKIQKDLMKAKQYNPQLSLKIIEHDIGQILGVQFIQITKKS